MKSTAEIDGGWYIPLDKKWATIFRYFKIPGKSYGHGYCISIRPKWYWIIKQPCVFVWAVFYKILFRVKITYKKCWEYSKLTGFTRDEWNEIMIEDAFRSWYISKPIHY